MRHYFDLESTLIVFGIILVLGSWGYFSIRKRRQGIEKTVQTLGYVLLSEEHRKSIVAALQGIPFFASCLKTLSIDNAYESEMSSGFVAFADTSIRQGWGRSRRYWQQTVYVLHASGANFPHFKLKPKTWWTNLRQAWKDRFSDYRKWDPPFQQSERSWKILADARDWERLGTILTTSRLQRFPTRLDSHIEVFGDWIFIYNPCKRVKAEKLADWVQSSRNFGNLLMQ